MAPHRARWLVVSTALGVAHFSFAGCSGSDTSKHPRGTAEAGEGGALDSAGSSSSPTPSGGSGGSNTQPFAGTAGVGGEGGMLGVAGADGGSGAPDEGGAAGASLAGAAGAGGDNGGATNDAGAGGAAGGMNEAGAGGSGGASEACALTPGSRISIAFDAANAERVTSLQWLDTDGVTTANVAASGGPATCGDPSEFFGASYGVGEGTTPYVVVAGSRSSAVACGLDVLINSADANCNAQAQIPAATEYHFYTGAQASQMRVTRTIGFNENSPAYSGVGVRPWQPRVGLAAFPNVIYPNAANDAVTTKAANTCGGDCVIAANAGWNGRWFADVSATGLAVIVLRDPAMTSPVSLTVNWDSYSTSNLASFVLMQPQGGWKAPITEVEYLCFADLKSWPQTQRDAAQLPANCGP